MSAIPNIFTVCCESPVIDGKITFCILFTRAYPTSTDYLTEPSTYLTDENNYCYSPGVLRNTPQERALEEFQEVFGNALASNAEVKDGLDFTSSSAKMLIGSALQARLIDWSERSGNLKFHSMIHVNFG